MIQTKRSFLTLTIISLILLANSLDSGNCEETLGIQHTQRKSLNDMKSIDDNIEKTLFSR